MDQKQLAQSLHRNLVILAGLSLIFLSTLAIAPAKEYFTEWRSTQQEYERLGARPMDVGIKQIWRPEIGLVDRCTSCHVGMGPTTALKSGPLVYRAHPEVHHDVAQMGCTVCHRGQGRATKKEAAHGRVKHWEDPMLERPHLQASCGGCHVIRSQPLARVERGAYLFDLHGCKSCHVVDGEGGVVGPDLSGVALKGYDRDWQIAHLRAPTRTVEGSKMMSFGHLSDDEVEVIVDYLDTLVGAPNLARGKSLAVELGCRGCHRIGGVGGSHGPDLSNVGPKYEADWHRQHFRTPQAVAPGSKMPAYQLDPKDEDALITYLLSLRTDVVSLEHLPKDTIRHRLEDGRDFANDGRSLYVTFCAVCHGVDGRGQQMASLGVTVPSVRNPDMLAIASADYLRHSIVHGRPGRDMPAWGGELRPEEIDSIVDYLRSGLEQPPTFAAVLDAPGDPELGRTIYSHDCAGCHGMDAEGTVIAPALRNAELMFVASDELLYQTIALGRANTGMPAHPHYSAQEVHSLLRWMRTSTRPHDHQKVITDVLHVSSLDAYRANGSAAYGRFVYESMCRGCHGLNGHGGVGTAITNRDFLATASDGFIAGSILLGRGQRAMQAFGPDGLANLRAREVSDLIAYLRLEGSQTSERPRGRQVQGVKDKGRELFAQLCSGCHGLDGGGASAPALNNVGFLAAATDGFLQATIARGRRGTAMRGWAHGGYGFAEISPEEINDIVAFVRSWER